MAYHGPLHTLGERSALPGSFTTSLLPTTSPPSSATLSTITSSCKCHGDHAGGLLYLWRVLPLGVVVPLILGWNSCFLQGATSIVVGSHKITGQLDHLVEI